MIAVTGASGQLGRLVIAALLNRVAPEQIVAVVRNPAKVEDLAAKGVQVREADYENPQALLAAFEGIDRLLLISSSEVGKRVAQHKNVIEAAKAAGVGTLVYTSILHADTSPMGLAEEHRETEALIREFGLPHVILRNGWYTENYLASVPDALQHGALIGCAGEGKISSAARKDYAKAAAIVLCSEGHTGKVYELAGDEAYTLSELATEIAKHTGNPMSYHNMSEEDYRNALISAGLPPTIAAMLAESDTGAAKGGLFDDSHQLSALIGRTTTPLETVVVGALNSLGE